jgi:hypothetical protein
MGFGSFILFFISFGVLSFVYSKKMAYAALHTWCIENQFEIDCTYRFRYLPGRTAVGKQILLKDSHRYMCEFNFTLKGLWGLGLNTQLAYCTKL